MPSLSYTQPFIFTDYIKPGIFFFFYIYICLLRQGFSM